MVHRIYFDNAATTPIDPRVLDAMQPFFRQGWGNPSSLHREGREARAAVDLARRRVAELLGAQPSEIVFTSSGTEADAMAIRGSLLAAGPRDAHLVTSAVEHPAVLACCQRLEREGVAVTRLPVDHDGVVDPDSLRQAMRPNTRLVSIMAANNVVGTLQPIAELARIAHEHGALFHTDAVQAAGKIPLSMRDHPIDLLSLSAHKLHGPKGTGVLYVRTGVPLTPLLEGGGQEGGRRSSTENVAGIVGLGAAAAIAREEMSDEAVRLVRIRDHIIDSIAAVLPNAYLIGDRYRRLPGHICLGFSGSEGEAIRLLLDLDEKGIAVSSGSACSARHSGEPSHVLEAMGFDPLRARGSLRITLGRFNTMEEANRLVEVLPESVRSLRTITSVASPGQPAATHRPTGSQIPGSNRQFQNQYQ
ncbi:MAG: cysteine desulfurase family protein [Planctomycetia bacterium]|nr:cysteine desulfurase family protein [Planctomycetia bacterium]